MRRRRTPPTRQIPRAGLVEDLKDRLVRCRRQRAELLNRVEALETGELGMARALRLEGWSSRWIAERLGISLAEARKLAEMADRG